MTELGGASGASRPRGTLLGGLVGLLAGAAALAVAVALAAAVYGGSTARRGGLLAALLAAALVFAGAFAFSRLGWVLGNGWTVSVAVAMGLAAFVLGHVLGYGEAKDFAWQYVREIAPDRFGPEWKTLDRDENFRRFVGWVTEREGGGVWGYLRLQAAMGVHSSRHTRTAGVQREWKVHGLGVWIVWLFQLGLFAVAGAVGAVAAWPTPPGRREGPVPERPAGRE
jgi:MFS family permease